MAGRGGEGRILLVLANTVFDYLGGSCVSDNESDKIQVPCGWFLILMCLYTWMKPRSLKWLCGDLTT